MLSRILIKEYFYCNNVLYRFNLSKLYNKMFLDFEERDSSLTGSIGEEEKENSKTMKTSEEAADFEKEFRSSNEGKNKVELCWEQNKSFTREELHIYS